MYMILFDVEFQQQYTVVIYNVIAFPKLMINHDQHISYCNKENGWKSLIRTKSSMFINNSLKTTHIHTHWKLRTHTHIVFV